MCTDASISTIPELTRPGQHQTPVSTVPTLSEGDVKDSRSKSHRPQDATGSGPEQLSADQDGMSITKNEIDEGTVKAKRLQPGKRKASPQKSHDKAAPQDEDKETISSAIYYPHLEQKIHLRQVGPSTANEAAKSKDRSSQLIEREDLETTSKARDSVRESHKIELQLQSEDEAHNVSLQGDIDDSTDGSQVAGSRSDSVEGPIVSAPESETDEEEALGLTTPKSTSLLSHDTIDAVPLKFGPPRAVLKPFDHQVGGHTALYRFSRRAICKKLNNKENKFYETVERFDPDLLQFLPR